MSKNHAPRDDLESDNCPEGLAHYKNDWLLKAQRRRRPFALYKHTRAPQDNYAPSKRLTESRAENFNHHGLDALNQLHVHEALVREEAIGRHRRRAA